MKKEKRIYLDNAATTPTDKRVLGVMEKAVEIYGNPSSLHKEGVEAKKALADARKIVADSIFAHSDEIIFTSGGTEGNNLAVFGAVGDPKGKHIVVSAIEHQSVLECVRELERRGAEVTYLASDEDGTVSPQSVKDVLRENTSLVSVMYANNEIGTIEPIAEIAKVLRDSQSHALFHTDACQAMNYLEMNVLRLWVDLMIFNGSKIYGPKGVGALYAKRGTKLSPCIFGGGQESGLRSGTENLASIVGFAEAVRITAEMKPNESTRLTELRDFFIHAVMSRIPQAILNGSRDNRLPNNVNFSFPGNDAEEIVIQLDARGIAASAGSACANISKNGEVSHVLLAIGADNSRAVSSVRFTLGRDTTKKDILLVVEELTKIVK